MKQLETIRDKWENIFLCDLDELTLLERLY